MTKISVIMPVYNGVETLERAVASVLRQTYPNWELLIIDDSSSDNSFSAALKYSQRDTRIRVWSTPENSGPGAARNEGLLRASGDVVAYLDCDDEMKADYLACVRHFAQKADVLIFGYEIVDERRHDGQCSIVIPTPEAANVFLCCPAPPLAFSHRRSIVEPSHGYRSTLFILVLLFPL
jgi:glycosyltransferase involved in cell wall biosynthesis